MIFQVNWSELYSARNIMKKKFPSIWGVPLIKKEMLLIEKFLRPNLRVLEIGAGDRRMEGRMKSLCAMVDYKSFDIDRSTTQDFYVLNEIKGQFDLIFGFELIEHMSPGEGLKMLQVLRERLTCDGILILGTPNLYHPHRYFGDITHVTPYKYEELGSLMILGGYNVRGVYRKYNDAFLRRVFRIYLLTWLHKLIGVDFATTVLIEATPSSAT